MSRAGESRERRAWTAHEDKLLLEAANQEEPGNLCPSRWSAIAAHIPNRTNKDCRKRWFAHFTTDIMKGAWTPEEDHRLMQGMEKHGPKWAKIAAVVKTRNSDQCAKRWKDTLDPSIDRTHWSTEADETLMRAVEEHGRMWTKIVNMYFPGKTGLAAKNRYNSLISLAKKSRSPSTYNTHPFCAHAAPGPDQSSMPSSSTPAIPIADLLSDTSYFDRSRYIGPSSSRSSPSSSSSSSRSMHARIAYSPPLHQENVQSNSRHDVPSSFQNRAVDDICTSYTSTCHSQLDPYLTTSQRQVPLSYFDMNPTSGSSLETDNDLGTFSMQPCTNTIPILSPHTSLSRSPNPNPSIPKTLASAHSSSSSSSSTRSSSSSVSTSLFDSFNSGDSLRSSLNQSLSMPDAIPLLEPDLKIEEDDLLPLDPRPTEHIQNKTNAIGSSEREDILLHIETLEGLHQELSDQEQRLKSQRSNFNRMANAQRRRGDDEGARQYEQESIKMVFKLNFIFEQQEGVDAQIASLRRKLEGSRI